GPGLMPLLAGAGNCVESPEFFPGLRIERGYEAAYAKLTARRPGDDFVLHDERRHGECVSGLGPGTLDGDIPLLAAAPGIERHEVTVDRAHEQRVAENGQPAIHPAAAGARLLRGSIRVGPERAPRGTVEGDHGARRLH